MTPTLRCGLAAFIAVSVCAASTSPLAPGSAALAQSAGQTQDTLPQQGRRFSWSIVNARVHAAVPTARRGLQLLAGPRDLETMKAAVHEMNATYRSLRAAQEMSETLRGRAQREKKFTDPGRKVQEEQMWSIRLHLLACLQRRSSLLQLNEPLLRQCTEHMQRAVAQLDVLVATMY